MGKSKDEERLDWLGANCWFCGQRPPVHGMSREVNMRKTVDGEGGGEKWLLSSVSVPRCAECHAGHRRVTRFGISVCLGGMLAAFLIVVVWSPIEMAGWLKAILVFLAAAPGGILIGGTSGLPKGQKPETAAESFSGVELMKQGGWMLDDTPR